MFVIVKLCRNLWCTVAFVCIFFVDLAIAQENKSVEVRIPEHTPGTFTQYQYFYALLDASLKATDKQYGKARLLPSNIEMVQNRQLIALERELLDVMWTVTSKVREKSALPVRVPLIKGLFGYRVLLIHKHNRYLFEHDVDVGNLKKLKAVQGFDWPDVGILRANGFNVSTSNYRSAFKLLANKFVDYFPRGVTEVGEELEKYQDKGIVIAPNFGFYYDSAIYFFVNNNNQALHDRIQQGLDLIQQSGLLEQIFNQQAFIQDALTMLKGRKMLHLDVALTEQTRAVMDAQQSLIQH